MKLFTFLLTVQLVSASSLANGVETPMDLLRQLPPLPQDVKDINCQPGQHIARRAEQIAAQSLQQLAPATMAFGSAAMAISDAQGDALSRLGDEEVTQCVFSVSLERESVTSSKHALRRDLEQLNDQAIQAHTHCGNGIGSDAACHDRASREHQKNLRLLVKKFLSTLQSPFAAWEKNITHCVNIRESAETAVIASGLKGMLLNQAQAARVQTYALPQVLAEGWSELCEAASLAVSNEAMQ